MVTDPDTGRVLLFGGRDANGGLADLWALAGAGGGRMSSEEPMARNLLGDRA